MMGVLLIALIPCVASVVAVYKVEMAKLDREAVVPYTARHYGAHVPEPVRSNGWRDAALPAGHVGRRTDRKGQPK